MKELILLFLKLGTLGFGGPAAHIAMMEEEVVNRRHWLSRERFLDLVGATSLIPGPNSTEMAMQVGYVRAGFAGLALGGLSFLLPAVLITGALAWFYRRYGALPAVEPFLYGVRPVILAILCVAVWRLTRSAGKQSRLLLLGALVAVGMVLGVNEIQLLVLGGAVGLAWHGLTAKTGAGVAPLMLLGPALFDPVRPTIMAVAIFFLKVGSALFGSGYVLIAFLQGELVDQRRWLTDQQLLDAVAAGQFTPGPVLSTATFVGYLIGGLPAAAVATGAIFLPSFIFVAALAPLVPRLRTRAWTSALLDAVNISSVGLMAGVSWVLARATLVDGPSAGIALAAGAAGLAWKLNPAWLVLAGGAAGYVVQG